MASFYGLIVYILLYVFKPADHIAALKPFRLALVVSILVLLFVIVSGKFKLAKGLIPALIVTYFALSFFSLFNSEYAAFGSISITHLLKPVILFFLIFCVLDTEEKIIKFISIFLYAIFVDIFVSVLAFRGGVLGYRLISYFQGIGADTNEYGMHILMILPFLIFLVETKEKLSQKMFFVFYIIFCCYAMVRTYSRGTTIAAVVVFIMFVWIRRKNKKFIFVMIILLICLSLITPQKFWDRLGTITADSSQADGSINARLIALQHGIELFEENIFFGVGFGAFRYASMRIAGFGEDTKHVAHNTYLEICVETGLINLIAFLMVILISIRICFSNTKVLNLQKSSSELKNINQALLMSLVVFCICVIFLSQRFDRFFYIIVACILSIRHVLLEKQNNTESGDIPENETDKSSSSALIA